jgi:MFS family permease
MSTAPLAMSPPVPAARAWTLLWIFVLLSCMSFVDRQILSLLAPALGRSLGFSDRQLGVLFGLGFAVVYALIGLPLAHLIDRWRRLPLVAAGVSLWSLCTVASGFVSSFPWLLVLRSGVAVGEAVLTPAAISIIADLFPREKCSLPTAIYCGSGTVMFTGAFMVGGAALQLATAMTARYGLEPWRLTLILVGLPGLLLAALLLLSAPEPPRMGEVGNEAFSTVAEALVYLRRERMLYGCFFVGVAAISMINSAIAAWTPTLLIRAHHIDAARAGYFYGAVGALCGILGVVAWPAVVKIWTERGSRDALVSVFAAAMTVSWMCLAVMGLTHSTVVLFVAAGSGHFCQAAVAVLAPLLIQLVAPGRMRARATAIYLMATSLVGLSLGPPLAAILSQHYFKGPFAIGSGLTTLVLTMGPIASVAIWMLHKPYRAALDGAESREAARGGRT